MPKIYGSSEIWGDLLVTGSFSILGSASIISSTNLIVSDTIISLGHSQSGFPILDEGIMFGRGTGLTQAFIWDETNDNFALVGTNDDHTVVGSINIDSYSNLRVGGLTTSTFKMTNGASNGYVLTSDASGNATWQSAPATVGIYSSTQSFTIGVTYSINHGLNTNNIVYNFWDESTGESIGVGVKRTGVNTIDINSAVTVSSGRIVIMGG